MPPTSQTPQTLTATSIAHFFIMMLAILFTLLVLLTIVLAKYECYQLSQIGGRHWAIEGYGSYGTFAGPWDEDVDAKGNVEEGSDEDEESLDEEEDSDQEGDSDDDLCVIEDIVVDEESSIGEGVVTGEQDSEGSHWDDSEGSSV